MEEQGRTDSRTKNRGINDQEKKRGRSEVGLGLGTSWLHAFSIHPLGQDSVQSVGAAEAASLAIGLAWCWLSG